MGTRYLPKRSFWAGWGGILITGAIAGIVVALLVGWVLLWVHRKEGINTTLLTLGCIAFSLVLGMLAILQNRLNVYWKLRQAEATYLAGISHNLRTPISAIRVAAQALQSTELVDSQRSRLREAIIHETRRLGLRVDNVLETGRLEVETKAFSGSRLNWSALIGEAAHEAGLTIQSHGGKIEVAIDEGIALYGDRRALRLVLDNLFDNALKYSDEPPNLHITLRKKEDFSVFSLQDEGIGFEAGSQPELFKRFSRGDTGRHGTGLGLSLSQAIVQSHGGEVRLESKGHNQGALVELWLPLAEEEEAIA